LIEILSFRRVFEVERRIYAVDRLHLNPTGIPVRGCVYALCLLSIGLVLDRLTPIVGLLPAYIRDVAVPLAGATLLTMVRLEGRTFHLSAWSAFRLLSSPRRLSGLVNRSRVGYRWCPPPLLVLPDGSEGRVRRLSYSGPGEVRVTVAHRPPDGRLHLRELAATRRPARGAVFVLAPRASLRTVPARRR
jgi:hypothetical protein